MPTPHDYAPQSAVASCPAATGMALDPGEHDGRLHGCTHFPDSAHRCSKPREHVSPRTGGDDFFIHECTDGFRWRSATDHPMHGHQLNPDPRILLTE